MTYDKFLEKTEELQNKLIKDLETIDKKIAKLNEEKMEVHEDFRIAKEKAFAEYEVFIKSENEKTLVVVETKVKETKATKKKK